MWKKSLFLTQWQKARWSVHVWVKNKKLDAKAVQKALLQRAGAVWAFKQANQVPASIWNKAWVHNGLSHPSFSLFTSSPSTPSSSYEKEIQMEMPDWKYSTYQPIYQTGSLEFKDLGVMLPHICAMYLLATSIKVKEFLQNSKNYNFILLSRFAAGLSFQNTNQISS